MARSAVSWISASEGREKTATLFRSSTATTRHRKLHTHAHTVKWLYMRQRAFKHVLLCSGGRSLAAYLYLHCSKVTLCRCVLAPGTLTVTDSV